MLFVCFRHIFILQKKGNKRRLKPQNALCSTLILRAARAFMYAGLGHLNNGHLRIAGLSLREGGGNHQAELSARI